MAKIELGEWDIEQAASGDPITFVDGTNVNFKIQSDGIVDAPRGELREQGNRVATRNWATGSNIAVGDLSGVSGQGDGNGLDADTVDGKEASELGGVESHDNLTNVSSGDHHTRYSDSEAVSAVESQGTISTDISGDADTVDGKHASDLVPTKIDSGSNSVSNDIASLVLNESNGSYYLEKWDDDNDKGTISIATPDRPQDANVTWYQDGGTVYWSVWQF